MGEWGVVRGMRGRGWVEGWGIGVGWGREWVLGLGGGCWGLTDSQL